MISCLRNMKKLFKGGRKGSPQPGEGKEGWRVSSRQYHGGGSTSMES